MTVLAGQSFNFAATPFFFELCCESVYPTPESVPGTVATLLNNVVAGIFFGLYYIPSIGETLTKTSSEVVFSVFVSKLPIYR